MAVNGRKWHENSNVMQWRNVSSSAMANGGEVSALSAITKLSAHQLKAVSQQYEISKQSK
jgi:hypothetical protein